MEKNERPIKAERKKHSEKRNSKAKSIPKKLKLLVTVVDRNKGELFADFIQAYSVNIQTMCAAHGTASTETLRYLGLGQSDKTVIFSAVREDKIKAVTEMLEEKFATVRNGKGIAFTIPFSSVIGVLTYGFLSDNRMTVKEDK
ncbi:MAG: hypothetical protein ACI4SK_03955 [Christensenellales bacterium]